MKRFTKTHRLFVWISLVLVVLALLAHFIPVKQAYVACSPGFQIDNEARYSIIAGESWAYDQNTSFDDSHTRFACNDQVAHRLYIL